MKTNSLSSRLLISTGLVLAAFFFLAAVALEKGFQRSTEQALREKLQIRIYSLLSAAELTPQGQLDLSDDLHEPRFSDPGSGLYALITQVDQQVIWHSLSAIGMNMPLIKNQKSGVFDFYLHDSGWYLLHYAVIWEQESADESIYVFTVAEDARFLVDQVTSFKQTLRTWLLAIGLLSLFTQFLVLRWGLKPLRKIGRDLNAMEQGKKNRLEGAYATELQGLAANLNALISSERAHSERYRNTLADLAHSLKTPLTIARGCIESPQMPVAQKQTLQEQVAKMNSIVEYQLQRAAAKGKKQLSGRLDLADVINKTVASLDKVYADKKVHVDKAINYSGLVYYAAGDVYEIVGNILDNAYKWSNQQIIIRVHSVPTGAYSLLLQFEDDGPGIAEHQLKEILKRGVRADENIHGHGIGMAVVYELICLLDGKLLGCRSKALGGMQWSVYLR